MPKSLVVSEFQLGVCYYPEHWPEALWASDFERMKDLGLSVVRMAEFAWSVFEPEEGQFSFDLFDRALDLTHRYGLKVILGTPTATPPAWLTKKYPETLNATQAGQPFQHGQRRHYNYNSPVFQKLSARIVQKLAEHYKDHPAVVGWQIDNELNCEVNVFYSEADHNAFRRWLKDRYGDLARLNEAWGTVFWSQTYNDWDQLYLTRPTPSDSPNPHQALDEKRFFSDSAIAFAKLQVEIIRAAAPGQWITTNGLFGHLDSHRLTEELLDFISYDSYPNFSTIFPDKGAAPLLDRKWSWNLSIARSISPNFAIMEQQSGPGGWVNRMAQPSPKPGQLRLWTYQSIAHGVDMLLYFRWRTATKGTEIYWHGIHDWDNRPNRRVAEVRQVSRELAGLGKRLAGTRYLAEVAIVKDYSNEWDGEYDRWHGPLTAHSTLEWFKALHRQHIPVDAFQLQENTSLADLLKYKVLIYPHPAILAPPAARLLEEYVSQGGIAIFGARSGYKDQTGQCYMQPLPGYLAELCGVTVDDFSLVGPDQPAPEFKLAGQAQFSTHGFFEILTPSAATAQVLAGYSDNYYQGKPALVRNSFGQGYSYYFGSAFNEDVASTLVKDYLPLTSPAAEWLSLPAEVELAIRQDSATGEKIFILLNYSETAQDITLKKEKLDLISGRRLAGISSLEAFGIRVLGE